MSAGSRKKVMPENGHDFHFKVPIARKRSAFLPVKNTNIQDKNMQNMQVENIMVRQKYRLVKMLYKLVKTPDKLSNGEKVVLMSHPIIKDLIQFSHKNN